MNKKFTDQKSSEKGYTPECGDKLPAIHPVNEKSPAHHQVNENSPAIHHDIQSRLTCDDYHTRDQAVYTTSSPKHEAIFPCVFCNEEFNDHADLKKHLEHLHSKVPEIQVIQLKQQHNASDVTPGNEKRSKSPSKTNKNNRDHSNEKSVSMETTQEESWDHIDSSKSNITVFSSDTSEVQKIKLSVNKQGIQTPTESSLMLREHFKNAKDSMLSSYLFKRKFKLLNLQQVEVPGNRYCFLSGILIALGETGMTKTFEQLSIQISEELHDNLCIYCEFLSDEE